MRFRVEPNASGSVVETVAVPSGFVQQAIVVPTLRTQEEVHAAFPIWEPETPYAAGDGSRPEVQSGDTSAVYVAANAGVSGEAVPGVMFDGGGPAIDGGAWLRQQAINGFPTWAALEVGTSGLYRPTLIGDRLFGTLVGGTSGATEPDWDAPQPITDGTVQWVEVLGWTPSTAVSGSGATPFVLEPGASDVLWVWLANGDFTTGLVSPVFDSETLVVLDGGIVWVGSGDSVDGFYGYITVEDTVHAIDGVTNIQSTSFGCQLIPSAVNEAVLVRVEGAAYVAALDIDLRYESGLHGPPEQKPVDGRLTVPEQTPYEDVHTSHEPVRLGT